MKMRSKIMKRVFSGILSLSIAVALFPVGETLQVQAAESGNVRFYVSPKGSKTGNGSESDPVSLERAQELVRKAGSNMNTDIEVLLEGGNYYLDSTLTFTLEDSGKNGHQVIWEAKDKENKPVISGGKVLDNNWELYDGTKNIYKLPIADKKFTTRDLYVNGTRATLARSRDTVSGLQYSTTQAAYEGKAEGNVETLGLKGSIADIVRGFGDISQLEAVRNVRWRHFEVPVEKVEGDIVYMSQTAWRNTSTTDRVHYDWNGASWRAYSGGVTYFQNAYALLDQPGEFYLDNTAHALYYIPREGEDLQNAQVVAPVLEKIMVLEGRDMNQVTEPQPGREKGGITEEKISDITFDGIVFSHNTFLRPGTENGYVGTQGGHTLTGAEADGPFSDPWGSYAAPPHGAVYVNSGDNITFQNCEFSKIGSTGLMVTKGSRNCTIDKNVFTDLSGGAIYLGENKHTSDTEEDPHAKGPSYSTSGIVSPAVVELEERERSYNNQISYNLVEWTGKQFSDTCAIWCGYEEDLKVVHNTVQHVPYSAINIGWGWRETGRVSRMHDNYIGYNRLIDYMRKETDMHDGGGLYMINAMPGTVIEYNYINRNGVDNAVYFDAGLDYATLRNNVMTNIEYKWVSANAVGLHRGMVAYNNYLDKGYGSTNGRPDYTFDGEYTTLGDNYTYTKVLPKEAEKIAINAGCDAPYNESTVDNPLDGAEILFYNLALKKQAEQSSGTNASNAVDDNLNNAASTSSQANPWWQVDTQRVQKLHSVDIYNVKNGTDAEALKDYYIFISEKAFGSQSLEELINNQEITKIHETSQPGTPSRIILPEDTKGRYVRIQMNGTGKLSLTEVRVNLDMDSNYVPYPKKTNADVNLAKPKNITYEVYSSGNPISGVIMDGVRLPEDAYQITNTKFVRNEFLSSENIQALLAKVGENNQWYEQVKKHYESIQDTPEEADGEVVTIKKEYLADNVKPGQVSIVLEFEKGMEINATLDAYNSVPEILAKYSFEEEGDTVKDSSKNATDLTITGVVQRDEEAILGKALYFDGNSVARANNPVSLGSLKQELLIDFYVKVMPREKDTNAQLINKRKMGGSDGFMVDLTKTNVLRFTAGGGSNVINTKDTLEEGKWYHITCSYKNRNMKLYLNGSLEAEKTLGSDANLNNTLALSLGRHADNTEPFTGYIDEVLMQNALDDTVAPVIMQSYPSNNAAGTAVTEKIRVEFSEPVQERDGKELAIVKADNIQIEAETILKNNVLTIKPNHSSDQLAYGTKYSIEIPDGTFIDANENELNGKYSFSFTTEDGLGNPILLDKEANFYKKTPNDVQLHVKTQGSILKEVKGNSNVLDDNQYKLEDDVLTIYGSYLAKLEETELQLEMIFDTNPEIALSAVIHLLNDAKKSVVASYDFNNVDNGKVLDISGNENHGTLINETAVGQSEAGYKYLDLDGTEQNILVADSSDTLNSFSDLYLELMVKVPETNNATMTLIQKKGMMQPGFALELQKDGKLNFVIRKNGGNATATTSANVILSGTEARWQKVQALFDSETQTMSIRVDGKEEAVQNVSGVSENTINNTNAKFGIGWAYNTGTEISKKSSFFKGQIAMVVIKNTLEGSSLPNLISVSPKNGEVEVKRGTKVKIDFDMNIQLPGSIEEPIIFQEKESKNQVLFYTEVSGNSITLKSQEDLGYNRTYEVIIPAGLVSSIDGNFYQKEIRTEFTTITGNSYVEQGSKEVEFDPADPSEMNIDIVFNGNTIKEVKSGEMVLEADSDYTITQEGVLLHQDFLNTLKEGCVITFIFSNDKQDSSVIDVVSHIVVAEYDFADLENPLVDNSGNCNDGVMGQGNEITDEAEFGKSLNFNGSEDSAIQISNNDSLSSFKNLTIDTWIKIPQEYTGTQTLVHKKGMGASGFALELHPQGALNFVIRKTGGNASLKTDTGLITAGVQSKWHHITAGYDRSNSKIFVTVDGKRAEASAAGVTSETLNNNNINLNLGHAVTGTTADSEKNSFFNGKMRRLVISNTIKDVIQPIVLGINILDGASQVATDSEILMQLSEDSLIVDENMITLEKAGMLVETRVNSAGNTVTLEPDSLEAGSTYLLTVPKDAVKDAAGNSLKQQVKISFTTAQEVDLTGLQNLYDSCLEKASDVRYTQETLAALKTAMEYAKGTLDKGQAAEQEEISKAITDLEKAVLELRYKEADVTALEEKLQEAENIDQTMLTEDTKLRLTEAIDQAKELLGREDLDITDQEEIKVTLDTLQDAISQIMYLPADITELENQYNEIKSKEAEWEDYTKDTVDRLNVVLVKVEEILKRTDLTIKDQTMINNLEEELKTSSLALTLKSADKSALKQRVSELLNEELGQYTTVSTMRLKNALSEAQKILADMDLSIREQDTVNSAITELNAGYLELEKKADKTSLVELVNKAKTIHRGSYSKETWDIFESKLAAANNILQNEDIGSSQQKLVDDCYRNLEEAIKALKEVVYKVVFRNYDGKVIKTQEVRYNETAAVPQNPYRKGYTFKEWDKSYKNIKADTTVTAVFSANKYKIVFNKNGGKGSMSKLYMTYGTSTRLNRNQFEKAGYLFKDWNSKKNGKGIRYSDRKNVSDITSTNGKTITLYAQWKKVTQPGKAKISKISRTKSKTIKVTLKNIKNVYGYEIRYSSNDSFKKSKRILATAAEGKYTSKTITGLKKNKTYFVKVRAYTKDSTGKKYYAKSWSVIKSVKVK